MESLWKFENIETCDSTPPKNIVEEQFNYLRRQTNGKIIGGIKEYDGEYQDQYKGGIISANIHTSFNELLEAQHIEQTFNVQSVLGEQNKLVYEIYLTSKATSNYKYRIGLLYYGVPFYPMNMVIELSLAEELGISPQVTCNNEDEFKEILSRILNSERIKAVISNLLKINEKA